MEKYLLELIREHNRVIVPNFGAFIVSRDKGQTILFNSFLSFNDGLLINHICKADNLENEPATLMVEEFVKTVNAALDLQGIFILENLGTFTKDPTGILRFVQKEPDGFQKNHPPVFTPSSRAASDDLLDIDPTGAPRAEIIEEPLTPSVSASKEKLLVIDPIPATPPPPPKPQPQPVKEEKRPVKQPVVHKKADIERQYSRKRTLPIWLILLLIMLPILIVLLYFLFFKGGFELNLFKSKAPVEQVNPIVPVPSGPEPTIVVQPAPEPVKPVATGRQHHIIVGSFNEEAKANQLMSSLISKGLTTTTILNYQGMYLVSAESQSSVSKALERQEALLKELQMENWVLTVR